MEFNPSQRAAASHFKGPMLVLAGPGSGKTTVMIERLKNLITQHKVPPENILAVTFSRAAAEEMKVRFEEETKGKINEPSFGTFHSVFYNILRSSSPGDHMRLISDREKYEFLKTQAERLSVIPENEKEFFGGLINAISKVKNSVKPVNIALPSGISVMDLKDICMSYERFKSKNGLLDFDDMILKCCRLLSENEEVRRWWQEQFRFLLIDEFQDINELQYETIKLLANAERNIFAVGDDDQSIYGFRGASPAIMKKFLSDFEGARCVRLDVNYRSEAEIIRAAGKIIGKNSDRIPKTIRAFKEESVYGRAKASQRVVISRYEDRAAECSAVAKELENCKDLSSVAVLFRGNRDSLLLQHELSVRNIPFQVKGRKQDISVHFIFKDMLAYVRLANAEPDQMERSDILRIINRPVRYIAHDPLRQADDSGTDYIAFMKHFYGSDPGMLARIGLFERSLKTLRGLPADAAYMYILKVIGYEEWLRAFAGDKHMDLSGYEDTLEVIRAVFNEAGSCVKLLADVRSGDIPGRQSEREEGEHSNRGVQIMTMHASKGLEFDTVYIPDVNEGVVPNKNNLSGGGLEEERRLFYVAMTRAKSCLRISYVDRLHEKKASPSIFLKEMQP